MKEESDSNEPFQRDGGTYSFLGNPKPKFVVFLGIWIYYGVSALAALFVIKEMIAYSFESRLSFSFDDKVSFLFMTVIASPSLIAVFQVTKDFLKGGSKDESGRRP